MTLGTKPWSGMPRQLLLTKMLEQEEISQRELARRVGTSQSVISKLEANQAGVREELARLIADAFGPDIGEGITLFEQMFARAGKQFRLREHVWAAEIRDTMRLVNARFGITGLEST